MPEDCFRISFVIRPLSARFWSERKEPLSASRIFRCPYRQALIALTGLDAYNGRVMRIAKHTYSPLVLVLSLGLMYSQVCNVICAFSNCAEPAPGRRAATVENGGHCHQEQPSSQQEQPSSGQHECPAHNSVVSILPSGTISTSDSHHAGQVAAELVSSFDILFVFDGTGADCGCQFRSTPRRPLLTVLRI